LGSKKRKVFVFTERGVVFFEKHVGTRIDSLILTCQRIHAIRLGMYVRTVKRKNKDGSIVEYIQLAHNVRDAKGGYTRADVVYSFGRRDQLDVDSIKRLAGSLCRLISPEDAIQTQAGIHGHTPLHFVSSRSAGGSLLLRGLWDRLQIGSCLTKSLQDRSFTSPIEEALFALVANRALAPRSKLSVEEWVEKDVYLGHNEGLQVQHFYRGMDFLLEHHEKIQKEIFWSVANLFNLTVDLIFFDTTNTYFEIDDPGESELKKYGKSKHKRDDLPQVTIGLAVTREGIPVRCWVLPGNQSDAKCVDQIQRDLNDWKLNRVIWVMDRGMTSDENRVILQRAGGHYILGEKLRIGNANKEALSRGVRFKVVRDNLHIKEVTVGRGTGCRRFIVVYNPEEAEHDRKIREKTLERITNEIKLLKDLSPEKQMKAKIELQSHRTMKRYLKEKENGTLCIDADKIREEENLDGKYLLSTSDDSLSANDAALGYKQ
jgi:hypothetical protein